MALYDRMIVQDVRAAGAELAGQEEELRESLRRLESLRDEKSDEVDAARARRAAAPERRCGSSGSRRRGRRRA
jgi:hypothetical protein